MTSRVPPALAGAVPARGRRRSVALAAAWLLLPGPALSDQLSSRIEETAVTARASDEIASTVTASKPALTVAPVPIVDPTLGQGLAVAGLYTFAASAVPGTPRSTVALVTGYTSTDSWLFGGGAKVYLDGDRYRVSLSGGYGSFNLDFYGVGANPVLAASPVAFNIEGSFVAATVQARVLEGAYVGLRARRLDTTATVDLPFSLLPPLTGGIALTGLGLVLEHDTREDSWWPKAGTQAAVELMRYDEALGSDGRFWTLDATAAAYHALTDRLVVAVQARVAAANEAAPFYLYPFATIRGFPATQYLDQAVVQAQAELRWDAWAGFGAVAFAGAALTAPGLDRLDEGRTAFAWGVGLRYRLSDADRMNIGADIAFSDEGYAAYFRIGEAF